MLSEKSAAVCADCAEELKRLVHLSGDQCNDFVGPPLQLARDLTYLGVESEGFLGSKNGHQQRWQKSLVINVSGVPGLHQCRNADFRDRRKRAHFRKTPDFADG